MRPIVCMIMGGIMVSTPAVPKASATMLRPGITEHTPMASGITNAALIAPVTTSPESKPMPTNMLGTKKVSVREMAYPGSKIHQMEMPYKIRTIDRAMAKPTPKDMADSRSFRETAPWVISTT